MVGDTSVAGIREYAKAITDAHGLNAVTGNARHHLEILADVLSGVHRYWAGTGCARCRKPLTQRNGETAELDDDVSELVCAECAAQADH